MDFVPTALVDAESITLSTSSKSDFIICLHKIGKYLIEDFIVMNDANHAS